MNYLTKPKPPTYEELNKMFDEQDLECKESRRMIKSLKEDFERLMADNIEKDEAYVDMKKYFQGDEKLYKRLNLKLRADIDKMQTAYGVYTNEIEELTAPELRKNVEELKGGVSLRLFSPDEEKEIRERWDPNNPINRWDGIEGDEEEE